MTCPAALRVRKRPPRRSRLRFASMMFCTRLGMSAKPPQHTQRRASGVGDKRAKYKDNVLKHMNSMTKVLPKSVCGYLSPYPTVLCNQPNNVKRITATAYTHPAVFQHGGSVLMYCRLDEKWLMDMIIGRMVVRMSSRNEGEADTSGTAGLGRPRNPTTRRLMATIHERQQRTQLSLL
jgi:hypothetical protein